MSSTTAKKSPLAEQIARMEAARLAKEAASPGGAFAESSPPSQRGPVSIKEALSQLIKVRVCVDCQETFEGILGLCPDCSEARLAVEEREKEAQKDKAREAEWHRICPVAYRHTDWARRGISAACVKISNEWHPGKDGKLCLLLHGETGAGKTRASFALLHRHFAEGYSVYAVHAGDAWDQGEHIQGLSSSARLQYSDDQRVAAAAAQCLRRARTCDILLIDDLGKERSGKDGLLSEAVGEALFGLIEYRLVHMLPIIATTNMDGTGLQKRLGPDRGAPLLRRLSDESLMPTI